MKKDRVVVAMSGGVDSSVVAALLHNQGYEVIGITMQLYDAGSATSVKTKSCCGTKDISDAKGVCDTLGIAHYVFDYESIFKQEVIDDFVSSYLSGSTPIPCVKCNQSVKFSNLLSAAQSLGAKFLATGHYVKKVVTNSGQAQLHKGEDETKDQSYFLFATTDNQLSFLEFPLGGLSKTQTRKLASQYGLQIAEKPDSQNICFVPNGSYAEVIERYNKNSFKDGDIVDFLTNKILGKHKGVANYTVGQRRGLNLSSCITEDTKPIYVVKIDPASNTVYVGEEAFLFATEFTLSGVNLIAESSFLNEKTFSCDMKLGSTELPVSGTVTIDVCTRTASVCLDNPYKAIAPGQACVFYNNTQVLGGGWINKK